MKQNTKDWIQHVNAVVLIASAIAMGFISFFLTKDIGAGPLTYIGEALSAALALLGITAFFDSRYSSLRTEVRREMDAMRDELREQRSEPAPDDGHGGEQEQQHPSHPPH